MFTSLIGNENAKHTLKRLIANSRVPNSLLFAGDEGVGKRQFALEVARAFLCNDKNEGEACGVCSVCTRIDSFEFPERTDKHKDEYRKVFFGAHLDVGTVVTYKRTILVDAIRDLERHANFRPYESTARFFIIDDADLMNDESSNALLKTLEEPPPTSYIFLITSRPDSLLPTIRSRCQTIRFSPVANDEIEEFLMKDRAFTRDEARVAARVSRGSIGRAVSINVGEYKKQRDRMLNVLRSVIDTGDRAALLKISEELNDAKNKDALEENLDILESLIHDVWTLRTSGDPARIVNADLDSQLSQLVENALSIDLPSWLAQIETMRENFAVNINRRIATDSLFAKMVA